MYISFAGDLKPTLSLISTHAVVSPGENIQFRCTTPKSRCNANAEFHLFIDGSYVSSEKHVSSATFNLNVGVSHEGVYSCNYSYQNTIIKSPWSNTVQITVGECLILYHCLHYIYSKCMKVNSFCIDVLFLSLCCWSSWEDAVVEAIFIQIHLNLIIEAL